MVGHRFELRSTQFYPTLYQRFTSYNYFSCPSYTQVVGSIGYFHRTIPKGYKKNKEKSRKQDNKKIQLILKIYMFIGIINYGFIWEFNLRKYKAHPGFK